MNWWQKLTRFIRSLFSSTKDLSNEQPQLDKNNSHSTIQIIPDATLATNTHQSTFRKEIWMDLFNLAKKTWKYEEVRVAPGFILYADQLRSKNLEEVIKEMLCHANRQSPGLIVPVSVPHTVYNINGVRAGRLFESDDVRQKLEQELIRDPDAIYAIVAYELCDKILCPLKSDICMFVLGFGPLFVRGYKREFVQNEYCTDHKLGQLEDADYNFLLSEVVELRRVDSTSLSLPEVTPKLKRVLVGKFLGSEIRMDENITSYKKRYPHLSEPDILDKMLQDLERK